MSSKTITSYQVNPLGMSKLLYLVMKKPQKIVFYIYTKVTDLIIYKLLKGPRVGLSIGSN